VGWGSRYDPHPSLAWGSIGVGPGVGWGGVGFYQGIPTAPRRISSNHCNNPMRALMGTAAPINTRTHGCCCCCCPHRYAHLWLLLPP